MFLPVFFLFVFGDNFEIGAGDFDVIYCADQTVYSRDMGRYNSVKISFLADSLLYLKEIRPREFLVLDKSVHFHRESSAMLFQIDLEKKRIGLADFVPPLIGFCVLCAVVSVRICNRMLRMLDDYLGKSRKKQHLQQRPLFCECL